MNEIIQPSTVRHGMLITGDDYATCIVYILYCAIGVSPINPSRLQVCQWIVERVKDGTIAVEEET